MLELIAAIDVKLMYFLNVSLHNPVFNWFLPAFHDDSSGRVILGIIFLALIIFGGAKGKWVVAGSFILLALSDPLSSHVIKPFFARIRPCNVLDGIWVFKNGNWLITPNPVIEIYKSSYSFTSSHAANTSGQAIWWGLYYPKMRSFLVILAIIVGYSRVYDGVHYPSDVFSGWVIGIVCFSIMWLAFQRLGPEVLKIKKAQS